MNIYLKALGCRLNEAELEDWAREFQDAGHTLVNQVEDAQLTVLNTCAVTKEAVRKSRKSINRLRRENPTSKLIVTGCFVATGEADNATDLGVDMIIDNQQKSTLVKLATNRWHIPIMPEGATLPNESALFKRNRHRAFIKIQDGCRYRCSYCIVTTARGDERSRSTKEIIAQINSLHDSGVKEVVLTGVHVGGYGSDIQSDLTTLVREILTSTSIPRVRFASVEPWDLGERFFELFDNQRLMPHMHLPIQSGSDTVLRRMSRRCHSGEFVELVNQARQTHAGFNVTTDIIVGFPGESEREWQETLEFVEQIGFGHIHIFSYSPRAGTKAAAMSDQINEGTKKNRSQELHLLAKKLKVEFLEKQIGDQASVLWETRTGNQTFGYTENYTRACITGNSNSINNEIASCHLTAVSSDSGGHMIATLL